VEHTRKRRQLDQPAVIGVAGKDPPKRQVGSNSASFLIVEKLTGPFPAAQVYDSAQRSF
jgi:hypothetical protein